MTLFLSQPEGAMPGPVSTITLQSGEIQLWHLHLPVSPPDQEMRALEACLSVDESARAGASASRDFRNQYVFVRARLRQILGEVLECSPLAVQFGYHAQGKPFLKSHSESKIEFSVSHAGSRALIAVAQKMKIGVDLETMDREVDPLKLARRFFSEPERSLLESLKSDPLSLRKEFFQIWTRKEALAKASGTGLGKSIQWETSRVPGWTLTDLSLGFPYLGALASDLNPLSLIEHRA